LCCIVREWEDFKEHQHPEQCEPSQSSKPRSPFRPRNERRSPFLQFVPPCNWLSSIRQAVPYADAGCTTGW
jgi:hypothetical protein